MKDQAKIELFETMPVPRACAKLAIPTVLSSLVMVLYNLADTYFVGLINDPIATSAVTLAAPVLLAFNAVINLFGVGSGSYISRCLGARDYDSVHRTSAFGFYCALVTSILFVLLCAVFQPGLLRLLGADAQTAGATSDYMLWTVTLGAVPSIINVTLANMVRSEGSSLHASIGTMSGCFLNILLDPVFIMPWGLNMGAAGAGCATFISNCVASLYFFALLFFKRDTTYISIHPKYFCFRRAIAGNVVSVGIPAAIQNLLNVVGMAVLNNFTSVYGPDAVAAMGITHKINMVPMYFAMGIGQGIMPLVGYNYAARNSERVKKTMRFSLEVTIVLVVAITLVFYFFSDALVSLFMKNEVIIGYGAKLLKGFCLALTFTAIDYFAVGVFQAVGMGKESFIFAILRKVALEIPALLLLNKLWPLYGLAYAQLLAEFVLAVVALIILRRLVAKIDKLAD